MNRLRFLHIALYHHKFISAVTGIFDGDERIANRYLFLDEEGPNAIKDGDYDVAYFHSLPDHAWRLLKLVPKDKTIIWWAWGYDLHSSNYGLPSFLPMRFMPITQSWRREAFGIKFSLKQPLKRIYGKLFVERYRKEVLHRVDYLQPVLAYEWQMMRNRYKDFHAKLFLMPFTHPTLHCSSGGLQGRNLIMLGNSGLFGGNLPDVIKVLDHAGVHDRQFIVPLSYGQSPLFMDRIKQYLKDSSLDYRVLDKFLPLEEYQKIMDSCRFMVNGSLVQAAIGNITFALMNGIKVFLWRDSELYHHYHEMGIKIFAIDDIDSHSFDEPLSNEDFQHNLDILNKDFDKRKNTFNQVINELLEKVQ